MSAVTEAIERVRQRAARINRYVSWTLIVVAVAVYVMVRAHYFFMVPKARTVSVDEGYIAAFALRLLNGHGLPYVDAVSQRGPITYWLAAVALAFGKTSFLPLRVLSLAVSLLAGAATFAVGALSVNRFVGALAFLAYALATSVIMGPHAGVGYNGELASLPFTMAGVACAARGVRIRNVRWLFASGALLALGALAKQLAAVLFVPVALWAFMAWEGAELRTRLRNVGSMLLGAAVPVSLVIVPYAITGHVRDLWYWGLEYNSTVYMAPVTLHVRHEFLTNWFRTNAYSVFLWLGLAFFGLARTGAPRVFAVGAVAAMIATLAPARPWENYYLYAVPWCALLFAVAVDALLGETRLRSPFLLTASAVLAFGCEAQAPSWKTADSEKRWRDLDIPTVCAYIDRMSDTNAPLFVWGFLGEYYVECRRAPASRYVIPAPVAGWVPWFPNLTIEQEDRFAAPGSRRTLVADLSESKPDVIIDAPYASMAGRSMTRYDELRAFIDRNYVVGQRFAGMTAYLRRQGRIAKAR